MYRVLLERRSERDLKKLPAEIFHRIIPQIKSLSENSHPSGCRKITASENAWRIRVGEYRIVYEVDSRGKTVRVMRVRHRKDVYKR